jgi:hypothetical protein
MPRISTAARHPGAAAAVGRRATDGGQPTDNEIGALAGTCASRMNLAVQAESALVPWQLRLAQAAVSVRSPSWSRPGLACYLAAGRCGPGWPAGSSQAADQDTFVASHFGVTVVWSSRQHDQGSAHRDRSEW